MFTKIDNEILEHLKKFLNSDQIIIEKEKFEDYSHDELPGLKYYPELVVFPKNTEEVSRVMKLANKFGFPVVPRGGGSGLTGGALPVYGGCVISLEKMNNILEIDSDNLMVTVEPGVITGVLQEAVEKEGLFYPPDPASMDVCSIGGNLAEGAGGPRAVKYGTTKDYVVGLEFVTPTGEICMCGGKLVKDAAGYNLIGLLVGSEGTLAIITKIILRLIPLPKFVSDLLIPFSDFKKAIKSVSEIIKAKILPSTIEFLDRESIKAYREFVKKPIQFEDAAAHLIIQLDGNSKEVIEGLYEEIWEICEKFGAEDIAVADNPQVRQRLWEGRRCLLDSLKAISPIVDVEDIVVPRASIPDFVEGVIKLGEKYKVRIANFGHAGDGNIHVNILKEQISDSEWDLLTPSLRKDIFQLAVKLGGEITGEHGVGYAKKDYLSLSTSQVEIDLMKKIKNAFDPKNILNPGKIFE